jgi:uncharacterized membrane protein YczE
MSELMQALVVVGTIVFAVGGGVLLGILGNKYINKHK